MPTAFSSLPFDEKQAFFSLLDEYFESRPHILEKFNQQQNVSPLQNATTTPTPTPVTRSQPPPPPSARRSIPSSTHSPTSSISNVNSNNNGPKIQIPQGLTSTKSIGRMNTTSSGKALGSLVMNKKPETPSNAGEAIRGAIPRNSTSSSSSSSSRTLPPPVQQTSIPNDVEEPEFGQAEVLFDYSSNETDDLQVKRFEIIDLIDKINDDWWRARSTDGKQREGIVPSTYVKRI